MITNALRSLWAEPRAADAPERVSRDWVLVGVLMVTALLEGVLRDNVTINAPTSTQSRHPRAGTAAARGSSHSERRAVVTRLA